MHEVILNEKNADKIIVSIIRGAGGTINEEKLKDIFKASEEWVTKIIADITLFNLVIDGDVDITGISEDRELIFYVKQK